MSETISCSSGDICNCVCNCHAFLTNSRLITVGDLVIVGNDYTFNYTITNQDPALGFVIFCIQCPTSIIEISSANNSIEITGNPNGIPVTFTECFVSGCQSATTNSFYVEYDLSNESCCRYQGIKIEINPDITIDEILFELTFTLPDGVVFGFNAGNLKLETSQVIEIVNDLCMPGCIDTCNMQINICELWKKEKNILESNEKVFIHFTQLLLPPDLDLSTITVQELESKIRSIVKLEKSAANLICDIAKVLEELNLLDPNGCYSQCTICL